MMVGVVTAASLLVALAFRLTSPVLRLISRADDYISWLMTFLPVATGLLASAHLGLRYETLLDPASPEPLRLLHLVPVRQADACVPVRLLARNDGHSHGTEGGRDMTAKTTAAGVPYDAQGDMSDADRRSAAMRGFIHEFGAVAAAYLEVLRALRHVRQRLPFLRFDRQSGLYADQ